VKQLIREWGWAILVAVPIVAASWYFSKPACHHHPVAAKVK
jgi:hypothetical protein